MKTSLLSIPLAASLLLGGCATQITEGPTGPSRPAPVVTSSPAPAPRPQPAESPRPTPAPVSRPTPYPIPQKPDTGTSPLAPSPDQPIWQRTQ